MKKSLMKKRLLMMKRKKVMTSKLGAWGAKPPISPFQLKKILGFDRSLLTQFWTLGGVFSSTQSVSCWVSCIFSFPTQNSPLLVRFIVRIDRTLILWIEFIVPGRLPVLIPRINHRLIHQMHPDFRHNQGHHGRFQNRL